MRKVMAYKAISSFNNLKQLEHEVNEMLKQGWELWGDLHTTMATRTIVRTQTLVKYEEIPDA
ncbi:hypothetical protein HYP93_gp16 [Stenotrophomonas phage Pokken]|uniref:Uncharacterized protein n=1 Tax=Stenotrophomonas phage Pokken TaxID=2596674 RepID=A0A5B9N6S0_9CAUD|nr:hypothetical protein HYP93_gp16 [Stenotrophomonas phage Pokken]QEG09239.1 hypothetical protein CPT_Pokken_016 [Stenotrophomonas phage Pokken]